jgi:hypothetical protein
MTDNDEQSIPSRGSIAKHDGPPGPIAHLPNTVHAGCRSCESDAGTGDIVGDLLVRLGSDIERLKKEVEHLVTLSMCEGSMSFDWRFRPRRIDCQ